jgi:putative molybdopterin biosynthesis protein
MVFLHDIPLRKAWDVFITALQDVQQWAPLGIIKIPIDEFAVGRILAEPVYALSSSPHYHSAAMDGYAVRAMETIGALPSIPIGLLSGKQTVYVDTGDPIPEWADAVIPIEQVELLDDDRQNTRNRFFARSILIRAAVTPWSHVRLVGEDIVASQIVLPSGHELRPVDIGAVAACGHTFLMVYRKPRVGIVPTGTELVPLGIHAEKGQIIEYNSIVMAAQVVCWGGIAKRYPICPDDFQLIFDAVKIAAEENDLVLLNAGSSAGSEDYSAQVVSAAGDLLVHGIAIRPGHPVILGMIKRLNCKKIPVIGVPGYPVSAVLTNEIFVNPLMAIWQGKKFPQPVQVKARITRKVISPAGDDDYVRVCVGKVGDQVLATPLSKGAGVLTSLVQADGIVIIPTGIQGVEIGGQVLVGMIRPKEEIEKTILMIGSHDMTLDLLSQFLIHRERRLISNNIGSLGGLVALSRGEAHLAGSHLLDPETGIYNLPYLNQYLPDLPVYVINWAKREQGLLVKKSNPKNISSLNDLTRPDVVFVNRQRGAGTRVLLDYHLMSLGIQKENVQGYAQEEFTHLAVAVAVDSGRADCALGLEAAANALHLDFVPLFHEQYDLVIPVSFRRDDLLKPLFELMNDQHFRQAITKLPGYDITDMGKVIFPREV